MRRDRSTFGADQARAALAAALLLPITLVLLSLLGLTDVHQPEPPRTEGAAYVESR